MSAQTLETELIQKEQSNIVHVPAISQADKLLEMAISTGASPEYLDKLLDLKERHDREEARKAFTAALSAFKAEGVIIKKDKKVSYETTNNDTVGYMHASLGNIVKQSVPAMAKHGLSSRWQTEQGDARVKVTCILTHEAGHSESTTLEASPDNSGKKNGIQQVASTITYLERYTFLAITGLAVEDQDDDGRNSEPPVETITEEQALALHAKITENGLDMALFMRWFTKAVKVESIDVLPAAYFEKVSKKLDETIAIKKQKETE